MEGIIYKIQPYQENDRLVFVYTKQGKITLIAKGAQKMTSDLRVIAQYLNHISFKEQNHKNMYILTDGKLLNDFNLIKRDYASVELASMAFELISTYVMENDDHENIFDLLKGVLMNFNKENSLSFGFKLLKYLGYQMNLKPDGRKVKGFSKELSSIVYQGENTYLSLDLELTTILLKLTYMSYDTIEKIEDYNFIKLKSFMYDYYEFHTDTTLKRI